jgi:hypothetical protein
VLLALRLTLPAWTMSQPSVSTVMVLTSARLVARVPLRPIPTRPPPLRLQRWASVVASCCARC